MFLVFKILQLKCIEENRGESGRESGRESGSGSGRGGAREGERGSGSEREGAGARERERESESEIRERDTKRKKILQVIHTRKVHLNLHQQQLLYNMIQNARRDWSPASR